MKFSIRIKNNIISKTALGSALLWVSAFALFSIPAYGKDTKKEAGNHEEEITAREVFEKLQTSDLEILNISTRLDMLDYWDVDSVYKVSNAMEGLSWIEALTPDYMKVHVSPVSSLEIKILPEKNSKIIMTIATVGDDVQAQDSRLRFFSEDLTELEEKKFIELPQIKDFFEIPKGSATSMKEIEDMIPFPTMAFSANPDNDNLEVRLTVEKFVNEDDWNIARLFVKPFITLEWKKNKFKVI